MADMKVSFLTKEDKLEVKTTDKSNSRNGILIFMIVLSSLLLFGANFKLKRKSLKSA